MRALVIIPTYNERENIAPLVEAIASYGRGIHILVVDDNSPDGTAKEVERLQVRFPQLHLLLRAEKKGLGRAYIAGFHWGLERGYDALIEMDADFSHRPEDLIKIVETLEGGAPFVVGSRYVSGGGTVNWGLGRKLLSRGGSFYAGAILGYPLKDWTGGFNGWRREVLEAIGLDNIRSDGYSFQVELKYRALRAGFKGREVPIIFEDRRVGESKMSLMIVFEAFYRVWKIRFT
ncbi:MAG TPA: polyprenol monophosphomannose synthase [Bdellovibrionales bacterium]|nr:polyprenol monophosphomannose synthase [Bdellovibrionales bacterium]